MSPPFTSAGAAEAVSPQKPEALPMRTVLSLISMPPFRVYVPRRRGVALAAAGLRAGRCAPPGPARVPPRALAARRPSLRAADAPCRVPRRWVVAPATADGVAHPVLQPAEQEVACHLRVEVGAQLAARDAVGQGARHELRIAPVQLVQLAAEVAFVAARLARQQLQPRRVVQRDLQVPRGQEAQPVGGALDDREARLDVGDQLVVEGGEHRVEEAALVLEVAVDGAHHAACALPRSA